MNMPEVYEGKNPYIFISYAHKDLSIVMPIIQKLNDMGFRVWYDAGIEAGTEWPKYIADHLKRSSCVMVFLSKNSVQSQNCRQEINFAISKQRNMLCVYLDDVDLPDGMEMQLGLSQAIYYKRSPNLNAFMSNLVKAEVLRPCCATQEKMSAPKPAPVSTPRSSSYTPRVHSESSVKYKKSGINPKIIGIGIGAVAVIAAVIVIIISISGKNPDGGDISLGGGSSVGNTDDSKLNDSEKYTKAVSLINEGSYYEAYQLFEQLGDYLDSLTLMRDIRENAMLQNIRSAKKGDIVCWGSYEQDDDKSNGSEDIEWIVLYEDNGKKLLLSQELLDCQQYNEKQGDSSWEKSLLRTWMNDDFYNEAFTPSEQQALYLPVLSNPKAENTRDYVFTLTMEEANLYLDLFENSEPTPYAVRQGANKESPRWWLRDLNNGAFTMSIACSFSDKSMINTKVEAADVAVRPCIWVDTRTETEKETEYNAALELFNAGNYKKAMTAFEQLGTYKDSHSYYDRCPKLITLKPYMDAAVGDEVQFGELDWIVLDKQEDKVLLLTKYAVDDIAYQEYWMSYPTYAESTLHKWLDATYNIGFVPTYLKATSEEMALVLPSKLTTAANPQYGTDSGGEFTDRFFILSYEEVMKYLPNAADRIAYRLDKQDTAVNWWLRDKGKTTSDALGVDMYGDISNEGYQIYATYIALYGRPAVWISIAE